MGLLHGQKPQERIRWQQTQSQGFKLSGGYFYCQNEAKIMTMFQVKGHLVGPLNSLLFLH